MTYVTFMKYCSHYHVDVAIQRAKEDARDTCVRLSIAVADPNLTEQDREILLEAQRTHAADARTQRVALKAVVKVGVQFNVLMTHFLATNDK